VTEAVSPELVLIDPELARRERAHVVARGIGEQATQVAVRMVTLTESAPTVSPVVTAPTAALGTKSAVERKIVGLILSAPTRFASTRILGEMQDELRRLDHLTRDQRAMVTEDARVNWRSKKRT
jgi:hypothetical protein